MNRSHRFFEPLREGAKKALEWVGLTILFVCLVIGGLIMAIGVLALTVLTGFKLEWEAST